MFNVANKTNAGQQPADHSSSNKNVSPAVSLPAVPVFQAIQATSSNSNKVLTGQNYIQGSSSGIKEQTDVKEPANNNQAPIQAVWERDRNPLVPGATFVDWDTGETYNPDTQKMINGNTQMEYTLTDEEHDDIMAEINQTVKILDPEHEMHIQKNKGTNVADVFLEFAEVQGIERATAAQYIPLVTEAHKKPDIQDFSSIQKNYQNLLKNTLSIPKAGIMDYHQSAGYEYEFASFMDMTRQTKEDEELMPSHVDLAHSEPFGAVFNLPFKLETDSGNSLEIATPPFIFLTSNESKNILSQVFDMFTGASSALEKNLSSGDNVLLPEKTIELEQGGFGEKWAFTANAKNLIATNNKKHKQGPYGQVNVSMTAKEITKLLLELDQEKGKSSFNITRDKTAVTYLVNTFNELLNSKYKPLKPNAGMLGAFLLYSRLAANIIAIPSILLRQDYRDYEKKPEPNYATEVKESFGLWVKDNPHKVVSEYLNTLGDDASGFIDIILDSQKTIVQMTLEQVNLRKGEVLNWITAMKMTKMEAEVNRNKGEFGKAKFNSQQEKLAAAKNLIVEKGNLEKRASEEIKKAFETWQDTYQKILVSELIAFNDIICKVKSPVQKGDKKTGFLGEEFGSGLGVRKDTYLGNIKGYNRNVHVGEIRGRSELDIFENEKND